MEIADQLGMSQIESRSLPNDKEEDNCTKEVGSKMFVKTAVENVPFSEICKEKN